MAISQPGNLDGELRKESRLNFQNPEAAEQFERGNAAMGRFDLPAAQAAFQRCVELAPESADAWCYLGMAFGAKQPAQALEALDRALALDPNHHGALYWQAEMHWIHGDARTAAKYLRHLNAIVPGVSHNLARLGLAQLAAGDVETAVATLRSAVDVGGGIATVAESQVELRRAIYLEVLNRREDALSLIHRVNGAGLVSPYSRDRYPRELAEQRRALEEVVGGRDIVVLGSGPSLGQLPPLLSQLGRDGCKNLCFFGFNNVPVAEKMLVDAIGRQVDLACMTSGAVMEIHTHWISDFLARHEPNLFLTLAGALTAGRPTADMISARAQKVFYFASNGDHPPIPEDPLHFPPINTLMCVLPLAVLAKPRQVFLFGCDGAAPAAAKDGSDVYFRQGSAEYGNQRIANEEYARWLARDTFFFNAIIPSTLQALAVLHRVELPPVYTCNPESAYRPFPRISGEQFLSQCRAETLPAGGSHWPLDELRAEVDKVRSNNWVARVASLLKLPFAKRMG